MKINLSKYNIIFIIISIFMSSINAQSEEILDLIILFDHKKDSLEQLADGAILRNMNTALEDQIPVIASIHLFEFYNDFNGIAKYEDRKKYLDRSNIYSSPNNAFIIILPADKEYKGFNYDNLIKHNKTPNYDYWKAPRDTNIEDEDKDIDIEDIDLILSNDEINKNIYAVGHGFYSSNIISNKSNPINDQSFLGMKIPTYKRLLNILNNKNCSFLYLTTCYGGGYNLYNAHREIEKENRPIFCKESLKFPIAISTTTDDLSFSNISDHSPELTSIDMPDFFNKLNELISYRKDNNIKHWIVTDKLKDILSIIADNNIYNVPSIWFPNTDEDSNSCKFFQSVDIGDLSQSITFNSIIDTQLKGDNKIDINLKQTILIYPPVIPIELNIIGDYIPAFISMIPGQAKHFIKSINFKDDGYYGDYPNNLYNALDQFNFYDESIRPIDYYDESTDLSSENHHGIGIAPKTFFIKKLSLPYNQVFSDIMIKIKYQEVDGILSSKSEAIFKAESKFYGPGDIIKKEINPSYIPKESYAPGYYKMQLLDEESFNKLPENERNRYLNKEKYNQSEGIYAYNYFVEFRDHTTTYSLIKRIDKDQANKEINNELLKKSKIHDSKAAKASLISPQQSEKILIETVNKEFGL